MQPSVAPGAIFICLFFLSQVPLLVLSRFDTGSFARSTQLSNQAALSSQYMLRSGRLVQGRKRTSTGRSYHPIQSAQGKSHRQPGEMGNKSAQSPNTYRKFLVNVQSGRQSRADHGSNLFAIDRNPLHRGQIWRLRDVDPTSLQALTVKFNKFNSTIGLHGQAR